MRVLIVGCGYIGQALGTRLVHEGHEVLGVCKSTATAQAISGVGMLPIVADITDSCEPLEFKGAFHWVVNCVSTGGGGEEAYRQVYLDGTRNLLRALDSGSIRRYVYTSSTSVYGQTDGSWVTEESATEPTSITAKVLVETEQYLLHKARKENCPAIIMRVAGIYGPGRGRWLRQISAESAKIQSDGDRFLNMIHRDDVVGAIIHALKGGLAGQIYNAVDDEPVRELECVRWMEQQRQRLNAPSRVVPEKSGKRGQTNKQVSNAKLRKELSYQFMYPTFREGFAQEMQQLTT